MQWVSQWKEPAQEKWTARSKLVSQNLVGDFDDVTKLILVSSGKEYCWAGEHVREGSERNEDKPKQKSWQHIWVYSQL